MTIKHADGREYVLCPKEPSAKQWGGLARDLMMWIDTSNGRPTGKTLRFHFEHGVGPMPEWLAQEIPDEDHVPSKGTRCAVIYAAMVDEAPPYEPADEVVERVARAMIIEDGDDPDGELYRSPGEGPDWRIYEDHARAAIRAFIRSIDPATLKGE